MHRNNARESSRGDRADRKLKPTAARSSRSLAIQHAAPARGPVATGDEDECGVSVADEALRARVHQRIQQRVYQLQAMDAARVPLARLAEAVPPPFMDSLHQDVVQTAAQILGKYLASAHLSDEPLELTLVHRMLVKEVELQALQRQRTSQAGP